MKPGLLGSKNLILLIVFFVYESVIVGLGGVLCVGGVRFFMHMCVCVCVCVSVCVCVCVCGVSLWRVCGG